MRIFGPKREKVAGGFRRLHNEELRNIYDSLNVTGVIKERCMRWAGQVKRVGQMKNAYKILVWETKRKRPVRRPRCRWKDNIRTDLREIGREKWMQTT
jgi:hypothetical protein